MTDCQRLRIAFAGTPPFAATALAALLESGHVVIGALTQPDRRSGRGRKLSASPVKALALAHDLPVLQPPSLKDEQSQAALAAWSPDVLVVAAYGLLLPSAVLALPTLGCINIHASLLPRWRGAAPIQRALLAGDARTGVAIMQMDAGLDTGAVIVERALDIAADETSASLHDRLAALGAELIVPALEGRCDGSLVPVAQAERGVSYAAKLDKREAVIDWAAPAVEIDRRIRAFDPWPVAESAIDGVRVRLRSSRPVAPSTSAASEPPGTVLALGTHGLEIATGEGVLSVASLQREGGKPLDAAVFARDRQLTGRRFVPVDGGEGAAGVTGEDSR